LTLLTACGFAGSPLCSPLDAAAQQGAVPDGGLRVGLEQGGLTYQSIERSSSGGVTNQETGHLPLIAATLGWQSAQGWALQGRYSRAKNDVAYQGYTQIGIPLNTITQLAVHQTDARLSYAWPVSSTLSWHPSMGLSHVRVDRSIQPALGSLPLQEVLDSTRLIAGLSLQHRWSGPEAVGTLRPVQLLAGVEVLSAVRNRLKVNSFGQFDPITLTPARQTDWRWHAKAQWSLTPRATVSLGVEHERLQPGSSSVEAWRRNGVAVTGVRYPGSQQTLQAWTLGVVWQF
jgi:hypothetical protein